MPELTLPTVGLEHYLVLSGALFTVGMLGVVFRRNALIMFMSIELMLTAVNLSFLAFSRARGDHTGHVFVLFVLAVAAAEAAVGLAIVLALFRLKETTDVDEISLMKW